MSTRRPTTPIRRISRGSISALGAAAPNPHATPLAHLEHAMRDIADDIGTLHLNLEQVQGIHEALGCFNENFAMYLYGLKMNAFCVEWPEVSGRIRQLSWGDIDARKRRSRFLCPLPSTETDGRELRACNGAAR